MLIFRLAIAETRIDSYVANRINLHAMLNHKQKYV